MIYEMSIKNYELKSLARKSTEINVVRLPGGRKKSASYLHRTAQPHTLAIFRSWGSSAGAGRIRLADCKYI